MSLKLSHIWIATALLLSALSSSAQSLPKLKRAEEISTGSFSNGVDYYLVNNSPLAGKADFALLQLGDFSVEDSRKSLIELDHTTPSDFLRSRGIPYTADGCISYYDGARVFRFPDVNVRDKATSDSTLLMMLDLMLLSDGPQTIIVCGDIDKAKFQDRLSTLSLVVPEVNRQKVEFSLPREASVLKNDSQSGRVTLSFQLGTASREDAGTAVPLMSEYLYMQLRYILKDRIELAFKEENIPFYVDLDKEEMAIIFREEDDERARGIIYEALADLAMGGATAEELKFAKELALPDIVSTGLKQGKANSFYVERCIYSIRSGSNLASEETIRNFFSHRKISQKRGLEHFNNVASALLGDEFKSTDGFRFKRQSFPDINSALKVLPKGVKLANSTTEPMSGGKIWMFSNGVKVIYKNIASEDGFHFCLAQRGGASSMGELEPGESSFLSDMFLLNRYCGIEGQEFMQMLSTRGVNMYFTVSLEDTILGGDAPKGELETVLKALLKIAYDRQSDGRAFEYYRRCKELQTSTSLPQIYSVMDSLMCPDYSYHQKSSAYNIKDGLLDRANSFFDQRFSNVSDGVFILMGNIPENEALSTLSKYLGTFDTSGSYALRERVHYDFYSGRITNIVEGDEASVNLAATGLLPVTTDNYLIFLLAKEAMRLQLAKSLNPLGMYAEVNGRVEIAPVERFSYYITIRPCAQDGLPEGVEVHDPLEVVNKLREEFSRMQYIVISDVEFASYKEIVKRNMSSSLSSSYGTMSYALFRYSNCRDLSSNYSKRIDKFVIDDLRWILEEIISSGIVEYIVK